MLTFKEQAFLAHLQALLTDERKALFDKVVRMRTNHLTIALENIFLPHNASAVLRSCESMGIQDVHMITEKYGEYEVSKTVVAGSSKWLNIQQYPQASSCYEHLKKQGYKLVATSPHATQTLDDLDVTPKTALLFGTEVEGISDYAMEEADEVITIPMFGFTESFNLSVSAALCIRSFISRLHHSDVAWQLSESEQEVLLLEWVKKTVREVPLQERYFEKHIWPSIKP